MRTIVTYDIPCPANPAAHTRMHTARSRKEGREGICSGGVDRVRGVPTSYVRQPPSWQTQLRTIQLLGAPVSVRVCALLRGWVGGCVGACVRVFLAPRPI